MNASVGFGKIHAISLFLPVISNSIPAFDPTKRRLWLSVTGLLFIFSVTSGCDIQDPSRNASNSTVPVPLKTAPPEVSRASVEKLCGHCHLFPEPKWLTQDAWRESIISMTKLNDFTLFYPDRPSTEDVINWYIKRAPKDPVLPQGVAKDEISTSGFDHSMLSLFSDGAEPPFISTIRSFSLLPSSPNDQIVVGDMKSGEILINETDPSDPARYRQIGKLNNPARLNAVDLDQDGLTDLLVSDLGSFLPLDHDLGKVTWLRQIAPAEFESIDLFDQLGRVADVETADFDDDGDLDLAVAEFGWHTTGHVILLENRTKDWSTPEFVQHLIDGRNGAVRIAGLDLNDDGRQDFVALIAQGHEMLVAYLNQGNLRFEGKILHRAPHPAWGYCALDDVDLDGDGDVDFVIGNGDTLDNAELKPFYEIAWLENRGNLEFEYHSLSEMFGVMALESGDLDGDGDLDIAAAGFTPGKVQSGTRHLTLPSLLWLEQKQSGKFERHVLEIDKLTHLSLTLDDVNSDGLPDIFVGNGNVRGEAGGSSEIEIWQSKRAP